MRIKLTSFGKRFLCLLVVMLIAAFNYNNSLAYLLVFWLSGLFVVAFLNAYLNILNLSLSSITVNNTFANQELNVKVNIAPKHYVKSHFVSASLAATNGISKPVVINASKPTAFESNISSLTRGLCNIEKLLLSSTYPLGLFYCSNVIDVTETAAWVYPQPIDYGLIPLSNEKSKNIDTNDFEGLVNWQQGDNLSGICWKTLAKNGQRMKKKFTEDANKKSTLFDWFKIEQLSDEQKLSQLSFWVKQTNNAGQEFGLILPNTTLNLSSGKAHCQKCLEALAAFKSGIRSVYQ